MAASEVEQALQRWVAAGLLDPSLAQRLRDQEAAASGGRRLRWSVLLALSVGGLALAAGILLFVAAHWDELSPAARMALVVGTCAGLHLGAGLTSDRFPPLSATLHAVGTAALGGGIFLAGQIFNLQAHWPTGVLLWSVGAGLGWLLLRDWPQAALFGVLLPAWLASEWTERVGHRSAAATPMIAGLLLLALVYLHAEDPGAARSNVRSALSWIGGLALIPLTLWLSMEGDWHRWRQGDPLPWAQALLAWLGAVAIPLALAFRLRHRAAWLLLLAALWVVLGPVAAQGGEAYPYLWALAGGAALAASGVFEGSRQRINLGVAGFALTVLIFYFSSVMSRLGRSASLIGLGLLLLAGGWGLEQARRGLLARLNGGRA